MITEDYVSLEIAKLLKGKGFDEYCFATYSTEIGDFITEGPIKNSEIDADKDDTYFCTAPTHQMAMKWLREVHNLSIDICIVQGREVSYMFNIWDFSSIHDNKFIGGIFDLREQLYDFKSYEEAVEAALKYVLENLI